MNFYQRLRDVREDADKSQEEIATILKIQQTQYSRYERGIQKMGIDKYIKFARHYNISIDYLAGIIDLPRPLLDKNTEQKSKVLTAKQTKLLQAYLENPELQSKIDKLLGI